MRQIITDQVAINNSTTINPNIELTSPCSSECLSVKSIATKPYEPLISSRGLLNSFVTARPSSNEWAKRWVADITQHVKEKPMNVMTCRKIKQTYWAYKNHSYWYVGFNSQNQLWNCKHFRHPTSEQLWLKYRYRLYFKLQQFNIVAVCPLQTYVCCSYFFLSQVIYIFPLFQHHYHTLPYPKAKEKQKLPEIKKKLTTTCILVWNRNIIVIQAIVDPLFSYYKWSNNCVGYLFNFRSPSGGIS